MAFLGFSEALAYAWQKEYITEQERSKENGFAQSLPHSTPNRERRLAAKWGSSEIHKS